MKLEFKINKYYLIGYTIASKNKPFPSWERLEEKIWEKYRDKPAYYFLNPKYINLALEEIQISLSNNNIKKVFAENAIILRKIYNDILKSREFAKLYKETKNHLKFAETQWSKNEECALTILKEISGLKLPKQKINVYITHPKSHNGKVVDKNTIVWGHNENWGNYSTVYLCHELLHIMTWPEHYGNNYKILHAIICLATNNELRIRLNKNGHYFKEKEIKTEYQEIIELEKKILPYWKEYLNGQLKNINNILKLRESIIKNWVV